MLIVQDDQLSNGKLLREGVTLKNGEIQTQGDRFTNFKKCLDELTGKDAKDEPIAPQLQAATQEDSTIRKTALLRAGNPGNNSEGDFPEGSSNGPSNTPLASYKDLSLIHI